MLITIKTKNNSSISTNVLHNILSNSIENLDDYVERIIVCDEDELENEISLWDNTVSITKLIGCTVNGKTIPHFNRSIIFITSNIINNLFENIIVQENNAVIYNDESLSSLQTIYHEVGHAKRNHTNGNIVTKKVAHSYEEVLNELWKILQDEYFAEMCCANIIKLKNSFKWYGEFTDEIESDNYVYYLNTYLHNGLKLDGNTALQMMHQYYFVPLFQKAGFLEGASKLLSIENIHICQTIQDIRNCNVTINNYVPLEFNNIVLKKWSEFKINEKINA